MAYFTYGQSVSTTPVTIFDVDTDGPSPRAFRAYCTTANCKLRLYGAVKDAENDELILTAGDDPFEFVLSSRMTNGISKIVAVTASGTASLTLETTAM